MGESDPVILFDGVCNLCNGAVQFIIKRDKSGKFKFAALQSETANKLLKNHPVVQDLTTIIFLEKGKLYTKSDAALKIARGLGGAWSLVYFFKIFPPSFRNWVYDWVAKNRYRWFGKKDECMVPTPELKQRFLN